MLRDQNIPYDVVEASITNAYSDDLSSIAKNAKSLGRFLKKEDSLTCYQDGVG